MLPYNYHPCTIHSDNVVYFFHKSSGWCQLTQLGPAASSRGHTGSLYHTSFHSFRERSTKERSVHTVNEGWSYELNFLPVELAPGPS